MRRCSGEARISWTVKIPEGVKANMCDHPAVESVMEFLPQSGKVWIDGEDNEPCEVFFEIHEEDIDVEEDEETN